MGQAFMGVGLIQFCKGHMALAVMDWAFTAKQNTTGNFARCATLARRAAGALLAATILNLRLNLDSRD
jgi:hypothetical protein